MINTNRKQWINTSVEYQWSDELGKLVQISKEGYWYEGEMSLAVGQWLTHTQASDWAVIVKNDYDTDSQVSMCWGDLGGMHINVPAASGVSNYLIHAVSSNGCNFQVTGGGWVGMGVSTTNILSPLHIKTGTNSTGVRMCTTSNSVYYRMYQTGAGGPNQRNWGIANNYTASGTFEIQQSSGNGEDSHPTTTRLTILDGGNVGIGDTTPSYKLEVTGTFYSSGSSIEYKQDVEPYTPPEGALMSLKPVQYDYKDEWKDFGKRYAGNSSKQLGFVAEDVAKILPELAVTKSEGGKEVVRNVDYEKLTVLLVSEVQNLRKELNEIKGNSGNN